MIDQGSGAKIMYPDLFKGLGLKLEDLDKYEFPLIGFDGNIIVPKGMIQLPMQTGSKVEGVDFIVVFFPYIQLSWLGCGYMLWGQFQPRCMLR